MKTQLLLSRVAVVLSRTSHPGNIGAAARAMKTMGIGDLVLVAPRHFPHPEAVALAAGAGDVLQRARVVPTLEQALADRTLAIGFSARGRDLSHPARDWRSAAPEAIAAAADGAVALVFGNETSGLSNDELLACQRHACIPANPDYPSLNLAAAVQVACYELALAASAFRIADRPPRAPATGADLEALHARLREVLVASGFLDPEEPGRLDERMRRLAARLDLESEEVAILHGMLGSLAPRK
ncbi:MAG TPA: RNA methyltransferase [Usitatibacteraceae bacterium]|nr:RNA methyltransferase [Usitatibacteraceae bacterium]